MAKPEFEIWDVHTHLSGVPGDTPEARLGKLLEYADRLGIAKLCVFMGMSFTYDPSPEVVRRENDEVLRALRHFPDRAFGFVYVNPRHTQASLDELNRCVRDGPMVGVKLWVAQRCHEPTLDPIVARATELKVPVLQHTWLKITGNLPGESMPEDMAQLAARHPHATIICAHTGGEWEGGIRAIRPYPHVYAELCGSDPTAGFTEMAVRELGAERVLYASDAGGRSFASQLAKVLGADIPTAAKRLILAGNAKRILQPILREKGIRL
ncbi:MAG: amidohydrolase [Planctomycetes bacterium]|nr:amidohydrolase [Planctomycetota bacterium]